MLRGLEESKIANENTRIKNALDSVSTNVVIVDMEGKIIYANRAIDGMLSSVNAVRQSANELIGVALSELHPTDYFNVQYLDGLRTSESFKLVFGERNLNVSINPVENELGERIGTSVEWVDYTEEREMQEEIDELIEAANQGSLAQRIDIGSKKGVFKIISQRLNELLKRCRCS